MEEDPKGEIEAGSRNRLLGLTLNRPVFDVTNHNRNGMRSNLAILGYVAYHRFPYFWDILNVSGIPDVLCSWQATTGSKAHDSHGIDSSYHRFR